MHHIQAATICDGWKNERMNSSESNPPRNASSPLSRICIAVSGNSMPELCERSAALLPEFPFQELRLDYLPDPLRSIADLRPHLQAHRAATFLATCRRVASGGLFRGTPEAEFTILLNAAQNGFALVDLSIESAEALPHDAIARLREAGGAVVLSWHDFDRTGDLEAVLQRMRPFAPVLCKIVPTAQNLCDTLPLLQLLQKHASENNPGIVGLAMGEAGAISRVLGVRAGSTFTFAASRPQEATAPGQIAARTLRDLYRLDRLSLATRLFGVAGDPIRSSLSPLMLNTAFEREGLDAVYLPLLTASAEELLRVARALSLSGFSVTMPLKQTVLPLLDHIDPLAARIGAVNTVRREPDGSFSGFNTDVAGIMEPLERQLSLRGARVLVLGAGGAARAAVFGCADRGANVSILNRTHTAAAKLAREAGAQAIEHESLVTEAPFDIIINATPAGMRGNVTGSPLQPEDLRTKLIFDLVYNPMETPLLRAARALKIDTIAGLEMFVHQGARQFELWTGQPAPVDTMREAVIMALQRFS